MKNSKTVKSLYCFIVLGIIFGISGIIITAINSVPKTIDILNYVFLVTQLVFGASIIIISTKITHKFFHFFTGLVFIFWSLLSIAIQVIPFVTTKELWPLYGVLAALALFISGLLKYGSLKFGYVIPSTTLFVMGVWYILFSTRIIKMSFTSVVANLGPLFLLSIALFLVIFFLMQQRHKELVFSDEEQGTFSDEEVSFKSETEEE